MPQSEPALMTLTSPPQPSLPLTIEQSLQQAIAHHLAGRLQEAGALYQSILQLQPAHAEANHNMGVVAAESKQLAEALPYFLAALEAEPAHGPYWLSYINALIQAGQLDAAREVLSIASQQGLRGDEVEALSAFLRVETTLEVHINSSNRHALNSTPDAVQVAKQSSAIEGKKNASTSDNSATLQDETPTLKEINSVLALFNHGQHPEAATLAQSMVTRYPLHGFGWNVLGASFKQMGRSADALLPLQKATALSPEDAYAHGNLGATLKDLGRLDEAEVSLRRALDIHSDFAEAHLNLGATLQDMGRLVEAESSYRHALQIKPDFAEAHYNLGIILKRLGHLDASRVCYKQALEIKPYFAEAHYSLGILVKEMGHLDEAEACYRQALQINPNYAEAHCNLGATLQSQDRLNEAEISYRQALQLNPDYAEAHCNLGFILHEQNRLDEAQVSYRNALQLKPDYADAHYNLSFTLQRLGQLDEAEACCRRALQIKPDFADAHNKLGYTLHELGRLDEAEACCRQALQIKPDFADAHLNLAFILQLLNKPDEAEACCRRALLIKPDHASAYENFLFFLSHNNGVEASALFAEHVRFGEQFETPLRASWPKHANSRDPERCLQIGIVSGDFRDHAVAPFIEPLLIHLATYPQLALHAYANHGKDDDTSKRLRTYFKHWHPIVGLSDAVLADKIRADGIDILIDLSGHTGKNRLLTFARKPAPLQASWLGYPGTTGLCAMDYYLADRFYLPPGQFDNQFTEKIVHMPVNVPFLPSADAPPVNALPALGNGYVTFGSFNRSTKLSHAVVSLWAQVLRSVPTSKMLLGAMPQEGQYDMLLGWFDEEGIDRERLSFQPRSTMAHYLGLHQQVDFCLDTFPYNGGTTTLHALWMGVPTLTLAGSTAAGRSGASNLGQLGLDGFIAHDAADFVQKGLFWAGNLSALAELRAGMRERFAQSTIGQPAVAAAGVERALRMMWQRWCEGLQAATFEVSLSDNKSANQEVDA